jgi:hypothetical protein
MVTAGSQCTANFVFTRGYEVLLGYAAHCASNGSASDTNGCTTGSRPLGTKVTIQGARRPGVLVYSSWLTMQRRRERNADICVSNDLALVRVDPADVRRVNPSIPHFGGPTGLNTSGLPAGAKLYAYGSSGLRAGLRQLSPKVGVSLGTDRGGWSHEAYTATPGIPGDSGSAMVDANGRATGVLSTIGLAPLPASNRFSDLARDLIYAYYAGYRGVALVKGTVPFTAKNVPLAI